MIRYGLFLLHFKKKITVGCYNFLETILNDFHFFISGSKILIFILKTFYNYTNHLA